MTLDDPRGRDEADRAADALVAYATDPEYGLSPREGAAILYWYAARLEAKADSHPRQYGPTTIAGPDLPTARVTPDPNGWDE
jgi:hypothetical protein